MRIKGAIFILLLAVAASIGFLLFGQKDRLQTRPWETGLDMNVLSKSVRDDAGHLYTIGNSQQTIFKLDESGTLQYRIDAASHQKGWIENFTDIAVDKDGNLYAVSTLLDPYGLYVMEERVQYYGTGAGQPRTLHTIEHGETSKHARIGSIQALQIVEGTLHFVKNEETRFELIRISPFGRMQTVLQSELPESVYAADFAGTDPEQLYFTSKRGRIYAWNEDSQSPQVVYPSGNSISWTGITVPDGLQVDALGRLYFVNTFRSQINRIDLNNPYLIEKLMSDDSLLEQDIADSVANTSHIYIAENGQLLVTTEDRIILRAFDGTLTELAHTAQLKTSEVIFNGAIWLLAAIELALLLYIIRFIYVHFMQRKVSLVFKQLSVFIPLLIISMSFLTVEVIDHFNEKLKEEAFRELTLIAHNGNRLIGRNLLNRLTTAADYNSPSYRQLKERIDEVYEGNDEFERQGTYTTIYKYIDDSLYIISDDDDSLNMFTPFPLTDENLSVLEQGHIVYGEWEDANGKWIYALGPLFDPDGEINGIYETGRDLIGLEQHNQALLNNVVQRIVVITIVVLLIFIALTYYLLAPLRQLRSSVSDLAEGRWDTEVHVRTHDEVGELGQRFNFMAEHIRKYISDITEMNKAYFRFVPQKFMQILNTRSILDARLGTQVEKVMTVMICNMRGFYDFSKELSPENNFKFVNSFLSRFGPVIRENKGVVNHYLGAGLMSLFPQHPQHAIQAAIQIREALEIYNGHRAKVGYRPIDVGIALHKGPLMLGIIGEEQRMENNVISDKVNLTEILERLTETVGSSILVTEDVLESVKNTDLFLYRSIGRVRIPEHDEPLQLYDVYQGDPEEVRVMKHKTKPTFEQAILMYQEGRFYDAREAFLEVIRLNRYDRAAQLYFYLSDKYYQSGAYHDWDGTLSA